jgi:hypothetical protein
MAPELLRSVRGAAYARACDVYSWGIMANEVLTQTVPYSDAMTEHVQVCTLDLTRLVHTPLAAQDQRPVRLRLRARSDIERS